MSSNRSNGKLSSSAGAIYLGVYSDNAIFQQLNQANKVERSQSASASEECRSLPIKIPIKPQNQFVHPASFKNSISNTFPNTLPNTFTSFGYYINKNCVTNDSNKKPEDNTESNLEDTSSKMSFTST